MKIIISCTIFQFFILQNPDYGIVTALAFDKVSFKLQRHNWSIMFLAKILKHH
ncbi:hypothetical protein KBJ98_14860 [Flavobacterium sp. F-328]|uniref:Uncharacterized protein n=1 Tax=Flavobacterium erciyesense TaxID=2825842 RepID=A0ABS5D7L3_9FLAO|nr:hypothetical protein [Flavobacterium erciyesense]MBQ0909990.1 hypothetical protein [Flavobacterium erciyesense]